MPNIQDVADAAGVSTATVTRVMSNPHKVSPELTRKVRRAIADLGYRPNMLARGLRRRSTQVLAVVVPDIQTQHFTQICRGVEDAAKRRGFNTMVCNSDDDLDREGEYFDMLAAQSVAGVMLASLSVALTDISVLTQAGIPVVSVDAELKGAADVVHSDNARGARLATRHLGEAGATRIGCVTGIAGMPSAELRLQGYQETVTALGLPCHPDLWAYTDYREDTAYDATLRLMQTADPPDGLFLANNRIVVGALRALRDLRLRVPQDVSLIGFDEMPWADLMAPSISTMGQPAYRIGQTAAQMVFERAAGYEGPPRNVALLPTLNVRESSVKPGHSPV